MLIVAIIILAIVLLVLLSRPRRGASSPLPFDQRMGESETAGVAVPERDDGDRSDFTPGGGDFGGGGSSGGWSEDGGGDGGD